MRDQLLVLCLRRLGPAATATVSSGPVCPQCPASLGRSFQQEPAPSLHPRLPLKPGQVPPRPWGGLMVQPQPQPR